MNRKWLNSIDLDRITLYPIQFANCDRLVNNDAVYIFDEVGCGKTISSGLMAMDYIHNHNKNVLVITTNALIRSEYGMGQFQSDLMYRLPFEALNYAGRITFINNDYRTGTPTSLIFTMRYRYIVIHLLRICPLRIL